MASTKISNVIVPEVYNPYVIARTVELSKIIASGIASRDPDLKFPAVGNQVKGGKTIHIPFWKSLVDAGGADDEVLSDQSGLTVNNIEAGESVAAIHLRGKAWGANDLARYLSGDDPMSAIANMNAAYWANRIQHVLIASLKGITVDEAGSPGTNAALKAHVLDISGESASAAVLSSEAMIDAMYLMGDHTAELGGILCNSATMAKLVKLNLIDTVRDADSPVEYKFYMGKPVIVDDALVAESGVNSIYFFGAGAVAFNEDTDGLEITETDRDTLKGEDVLISRRAFVMHPRGLKWVGTPAGVTPSNAELAKASNWQLADNLKNVPITKLVCKLA